ncbi:hypothetical protein BCV70DRAFT_230278 [Testicularia cyperi]|uniref:Uncharacterized protein n=1 Tax=Testicularia cyperi TaxID=1882483 RepID=A0A317XW22_9BASI|nr:hypothetical protein BCV70DRAFT_230278 [Testicularia cyperi]
MTLKWKYKPRGPSTMLLLSHVIPLSSPSYASISPLDLVPIHLRYCSLGARVFDRLPAERGQQFTSQQFREQTCDTAQAQNFRYLNLRHTREAIRVTPRLRPDRLPCLRSSRQDCWLYCST